MLHIPVIRVARWGDVTFRGGGMDPSNAATFGIILLIVLLVSACEYEVCEKRLFPDCVPKIAAVLKKEN